MNRNILKSIGAILAGFVFVVIISILTDLTLVKTGLMKQPFEAKEYKRYILGFNFYRQDTLRIIFLKDANATDPTGLLAGDNKGLQTCNGEA